MSAPSPAPAAPSPGRFTLVLPYANAARATPYWACEEGRLDWTQPGLATERCTVAFAAVELRDALRHLVPAGEVVFAETIPATGAWAWVGPVPHWADLGRPAPELAAHRGAFAVLPAGDAAEPRVLLTGRGAAGTLYAVYAWLERLGWRWFTPGPAGTCRPEPQATWPVAGEALVTTPAFDLFRGFHVAFAGMESTDVFHWMARNRLDTWSHHPASQPLLHKLGFTTLSGGHVLETIFDPDAPQPGGGTLFETHPEWFAQVKGERTRAQAHRYQPCFSNPGALDHLARHVVGHCAHDWRETDYQNLWLFDTWAGWCECDACQALGNDADRYLHVLAAVRRGLDAAHAGGRLSRPPPGLVLVAYEGTPSLDGPSRPIPPELRDGRDCALYAPINRCYAHSLADPACDELNGHYARTLGEWGRVADQFPLAVVEYYNVSKFEDLPVLFTRTMGADFRHYHAVGVRGMTYMHLPVALWGFRALTQRLFAALAWDPQADVAALVSDYLHHWYGPAAAVMRRCYDHLESAYANITAWRNWLERSVNRRLLAWDGVTRPIEPLFVLRHLQPDGAEPPGEAIGPGESMRHLDAAAAALTEALALPVPAAVRRRLEEDERFLRYGDASFRLYDAVARLYEAERLGREDEARATWPEVAHHAATLRAMWVPFDYVYPGPGVRCRDGLARTQLTDLIDRLRERYGA
jgi:hypothetical protein